MSTRKNVSITALYINIVLLCLLHHFICYAEKRHEHCLRRIRASYSHYYYYYHYLGDGSSVQFKTSLFKWLLHVETHLGPDGTRLTQNAQARLKSVYKHAGQLVYGN